MTTKMDAQNVYGSPLGYRQMLNLQNALGSESYWNEKFQPSLPTTPQKAPTLWERWHAWRSERLGITMKGKFTELQLLRVAEREYGNSYYTDQLIRAEKEFAEITCAHIYHSARAGKKDFKQPQVQGIEKPDAPLASKDAM